jgi:hypothetical protein
MTRKNWTSIGILKETKKKLNSIKNYPKETNDDILNRLIKDAVDEDVNGGGE